MIMSLDHQHCLHVCMIEAPCIHRPPFLYGSGELQPVVQRDQLPVERWRRGRCPRLGARHEPGPIGQPLSFVSGGGVFSAQHAGEAAVKPGHAHVGVVCTS